MTLNQRVRRRQSYKLPASSRRASEFIFWVLAALLLGALGWVWHQTQSPRPVPRSPAQLGKKNPAARSQPASAPVGSATGPAGPASSSPSNRSASALGSEALSRPPLDTLEAQLALARLGISCGSLDGVLGPQTRAALRAFQAREHLPPTGALDAVTQSRMRPPAPPFVRYGVASNDLARLQPVAPTWLGKSQQSALDYESLLEAVAEMSQANPKLIRQLNPGVNWSNVLVGTELRLPNAAYPEPTEPAAFVRISLSAKTLQVFGDSSNLLAHFPCSIAQRVEKRPVGELHVIAIAPDPNYTFDPEVFPESPEARAIGHKLILPPGPNNPVGVAWISLDRPGYGIHGTPNPEQVGRTESHGCFRLANWNAAYLLKLVNIGTPVYVVP